MAILKNMLPYEKQAVADDPITNIYCSDNHDGQFMQLFFAHKEAEITI